MQSLTIILCSILFIEQNFLNLLLISNESQSRAHTNIVSTVSCGIADKAYTG